jgi:hypothetical protein
VRVPQSFLGISTEYWSVPRYERQYQIFDRVLGYLRVADGGPLILRIGGDSADHTYWEPVERAMPSTAFEVTPKWLRAAAMLVRQADLRVILDLNLVAHSSGMAVQWVRAAGAALPPGSIRGYEIGNEPDLYHRQAWYRLVTLERRGIEPAVKLGQFSSASYQHDFKWYARALRRFGGGVPILGPEVANPAVDMGWVSRLVARERRSLGTVTGHRYPLSDCVKRRASSRYPTIARVLSEQSSAGMADSVRPAVKLAHRSGLKFRLTEMNSVTCGGRRGVSDTFATALWAPDAMFELLRARVDGINIHLRSDAYNAPFVFRDGRLQARPLLYGMIMFAQALGPHGQLLRSQLRAAPDLHLKVWAVRDSPHRLRVLVIAKGSRSVALHLRLPSHAPATVSRLVAPGVTARTGVTLSGRQLDAEGRWQGQPVTELIQSGPRGYDLVLPGMSAALLSVSLPAHMATASVRATAAAGARARAAVRSPRAPARGRRAARDRRPRSGASNPGASRASRRPPAAPARHARSRRARHRGD